MLMAHELFSYSGNQCAFYKVFLRFNNLVRNGKNVIFLYGCRNKNSVLFLGKHINSI